MAPPAEEPGLAEVVRQAGERFAAAMRAFEPFETAPRLAVAVSGGADSLALCLLAKDWAAARDGSLSALTVDHGLRPESAAEAAQVGRWMAARGVPHAVLRWEGPKPATGVQAAAREARYRLLRRWCRDQGVLHLLVGHQRLDQAETVLHRLLRGSGPAGLAGMAALVETADVRVLRPLLSWRPEELRALLRTAGQEWLEDPSNRDERYARPRLRRLLTGGVPGGLSADELVAASAVMARARTAAEDAAASLLARACRVHPAGFVRLDREAMAAAAPVAAEAALARVLAAVGGRTAGREEVRRAAERLFRCGLRGTTLAHCRLLLVEGATLLVCREARHLPEPCRLSAGETVLWDRRFEVVVPRDCPADEAGLQLRPLLPDDWRTLRAAALRRDDPGRPRLPAVVRCTLPVLADAYGLLAVPTLGYVRTDPHVPRAEEIRARWCPARGTGGGGYFLAAASSRIISVL